MKTRRNYKDTLFRMLFNDKKSLLDLYNAVNGTEYDNADAFRENMITSLRDTT